MQLHYKAWLCNVIAPFNSSRIKNSANKWFDGEIAEKIHTQVKLYKKFESAKLHVDKEVNKEVHKLVQNLILKKRKACSEKKKLKETIANPEKFWETLKELGLQKKVTLHWCLFESKWRVKI